jgi:hypothetical protein
MQAAATAAAAAPPRLRDAFLLRRALLYRHSARPYHARVVLRHVLARSPATDAAWALLSDIEHYELGRASGTGGYFEARTVLQDACGLAGDRLKMRQLLLLLHAEHGQARAAAMCILDVHAGWPRASPLAYLLYVAGCR